MQREYFWKAKGIQLEGKRNTVGRQKDYSWKVKVVFLQGNGKRIRDAALSIIIHSFTFAP